ncbi:exported hypothetical protein [Azospirillaceae bacterium]
MPLPYPLKMFLSTLTLTAFLSVVLAQNNPPAPLVTDNLPGSGFTVGLNGGAGNITGSFSFDVGNAVYSAGVQVAASLTGFNLTDDNTYSKSATSVTILPRRDANVVVSISHPRKTGPSRWQLHRHRRAF